MFQEAILNEFIRDNNYMNKHKNVNNKENYIDNLSNIKINVNNIERIIKKNVGKHRKYLYKKIFNIINNKENNTMKLIKIHNYNARKKIIRKKDEKNCKSKRYIEIIIKKK